MHWEYSQCTSGSPPIILRSPLQESNCYYCHFKDEAKRLRNFPRVTNTTSKWQSWDSNPQSLTPESKHLVPTLTAFSKIRPEAVKTLGMGSFIGKEVCVQVEMQVSAGPRFNELQMGT